MLLLWAGSPNGILLYQEWVGVQEPVLFTAYLQTQTLADLCSTYPGGGFKRLSTRTPQSCSLHAQPTLHPVHARSYLCIFCTSS